MRIVRNKIARKRRNSFIPSASYGIRAEMQFWEDCNEVAEIEGTSRNELIVRVVSKYCTRKLSKMNKKSLDNK